MSKDDRLSKAQKPSQEALRLHPFYRGKYQTVPKAAIRSFQDFAIWSIAWRRGTVHGHLRQS